MTEHPFKAGDWAIYRETGCLVRVKRAYTLTLTDKHYHDVIINFACGCQPDSGRLWLMCIAPNGRPHSTVLVSLLADQLKPAP